MQMAPYERNRPESEYLENYRETDFMLNILKQYGFSDVHVEKFDSDPQWDAVRGRLTITGPLDNSPSLKRGDSPTYTVYRLSYLEFLLRCGYFC